MYKLRTHTGTLQFPTLDAAKTHIRRLYQQGAIRNGYTETVQDPAGNYVTLRLSFGAVMEARV
jgi:hypothetical protein